MPNQEIKPEGRMASSDVEVQSELPQREVGCPSLRDILASCADTVFEC